MLKRKRHTVNTEKGIRFYVYYLVGTMFSIFVSIVFILQLQSVKMEKQHNIEHENHLGIAQRGQAIMEEISSLKLWFRDFKLKIDKTLTSKSPIEFNYNKEGRLNNTLLVVERNIESIISLQNKYQEHGNSYLESQLVKEYQKFKNKLNETKNLDFLNYLNIDEAVEPFYIAIHQLQRFHEVKYRQLSASRNESKRASILIITVMVSILLILGIAVIFRVLLQLRHVLSERNKAEEILMEREENFRSITENSNEGIIVNLDGSQVFVNRVLENILGYSQGALIGSTLHDIVHPDDLQKVMNTYRRRLHGELVPNQLEIRLKTRVGISVDALFITAITKWQGKPAGLFMIHDITEQKIIRSRLEKQAKIIDQVHDSVIAADLEGYITSWSKGAQRLYGYSEKEMLGKHVTLFTPDYSRDMYKQKAFAPVIEKGNNELEVRRICKNGEEKYVHLSLSALHDETGKLSGVIGYSIDITDRQRVNKILEALASGSIELDFEQFLRESVRYLSEVFQSKYAIVGLLGPDGVSIETQVVWAGSGFAENFTYELEHTPCYDVLTEHKRLVPRDVFGLYPKDLMLEKMGLESYFGVSLISSTGKKVGLVIVMDEKPMVIEQWTESVLEIFANRISRQIERNSISSELIQHQEHLEEIVKSRTDDLAQSLVRLQEENSERLKAEQSLIRAKEEAEQANLLKSEFLSRMSHELRTPMNAILGFSQLLEKDHLNEDQKSYIDEVLSAGYHLQDLIDEVLDLSRIESGRYSISISDISLYEVIYECIALVQRLVKEHDITIISHIDFKSDIFLTADRMRLKEVIVNLLSNAIKYNKKSGEISISCKKLNESNVRISVEDTGVGISEENQKNIFEPFNRLGAEYSDIEGTGIGLTISKQLMELMNGEIGLKSTVGKGSTFWIDCPVSKTHSGYKKENAQKKDVNVPGQQFTLLYIEDNPANLRLIQHIIGRHDELTLYTATSAEEGIVIAGKELPDLMIIDINLPGMDGYQALSILRESGKTRDIPVFALSAAARPRDVERGLTAGFKRYLTKPVDVEEFMDAIRDELQLKQVS